MSAPALKNPERPLVRMMTRASSLNRSSSRATSISAIISRSYVLAFPLAISMIPTWSSTRVRMNLPSMESPRDVGAAELGSPDKGYGGLRGPAAGTGQYLVDRAVRKADVHPAREPEEQSGLDDPRDPPELLLQGGRIVDGTGGREVEDLVAVVREPRGPVGRGPGERDDLDRDRGPGAEPGDQLRVVDEDEHLLREPSEHLLPEQGPAAALGHGEVGIDLVGAVEHDIELVVLAEGPDREAEAHRELRGGERAADAVEPPLREPLREGPDRIRRRRAGAQGHGGAGMDAPDGGPGRQVLLPGELLGGTHRGHGAVLPDNPSPGRPKPTSPRPASGAPVSPPMPAGVRPVVLSVGGSVLATGADDAPYY